MPKTIIFKVIFAYIIVTIFEIINIKIIIRYVGNWNTINHSLESQKYIT